MGNSSSNTKHKRTVSSQSQIEVAAKLNHGRPSGGSKMRESRSNVSATYESRHMFRQSSQLEWDLGEVKELHKEYQSELMRLQSLHEGETPTHSELMHAAITAPSASSWTCGCIFFSRGNTSHVDEVPQPVPSDSQPAVSNRAPESSNGDVDVVAMNRRQMSAPAGTAVFTREPSNKRLSLEISEDMDALHRDVHVDPIPDELPTLAGRASVSSVSDTDGFKRHRMRDARNSLMSLRRQIPNSLLNNLSPDIFNQLEKVSDEIIQLLQNEYLSAHLREMRDRREFLMRAATDLTVPDAEREVARWLSSTYLRRSEPAPPIAVLPPKQMSLESSTMNTMEDHLEIPEPNRLLSIDETVITETVAEMSPEVTEILKNINSWDFDVFALDKFCGHECLPVVMLTILGQRNLFASLGINKLFAQRYFQSVSDAYKDNPYHNYLHGCDVVVSMHFFMHSDAFRYEDDVDLFSILLASVCHDVGHPGNTNGFEVNTESELAITYNDEAVLENFHIALAWRLMKKTDCNILDGFTKENMRRVRRTMITCILATDMTKHIESAKSLDELVQMKKGEVNGDWRNASEFLPLALHTADLGNPAKPLQFYSQWVDRLMSEFFAQGDVERNLGLDVSQLCDRMSVDIPSGQVGFINFVIRPWFASWAELLSEEDQGPYFLDLIDENYRFMETKRFDIESTKNDTTEPNLPTQSPSPPLSAHPSVSIVGLASTEIVPAVTSTDSIRSINSETERSVRFSMTHEQSPRESTQNRPTFDDLILREETDTVYPLRDNRAGKETPRSRSSKSYSIVGMTMSEIQNRLGEIRVSAGIQSMSAHELSALPQEDEEHE